MNQEIQTPDQAFTIYYDPDIVDVTRYESDIQAARTAERLEMVTRIGSEAIRFVGAYTAAVGQRTGSLLLAVPGVIWRDMTEQ